MGKNRAMEGEEDKFLGCWLLPRNLNSSQVLDNFFLVVTDDDIDLGYEERPVNRYGSPIALPESGRSVLQVAGCRLKFNFNWKTAGN